MEEMLGSLLDVSRADLGTLQPAVEPVALGSLLARTFSAHAGAASAKALRLRVRPSSYCGLSDPALLYRMLDNLVSNAIRYTERGGVLVGVRAAGGMLRIEVWDTGIGIPAQYRALIYQEFFQVGNPERDPRKGLGLGLSLVERLSRLLGHAVSMDSVPGRGTVFRIALPRAPASGDRGGETPAASCGRGTARLLVIGASATLCEEVCKLLTEWEYEADCLLAPCPDELPPACRPDVVLCEDAALEAGLPLLRTLRAAGALPLIVLGAPPDGYPAAGCGCPLHVLPKPVHPAKLRALISHLSGKEEACASTDRGEKECTTRHTGIPS